MIGPLSVHWYGVMYACAFIVGLWIFRRLQRYRNLQLSEQQIDSMFLSLFLGVLIGGRLGYVLFYGDALYFSDPLEILRVWHGGMASHGGFIGVLIAMIIFTRRTRISFLSLCDVLTVPIALGLAFGRLGNFINLELYGTPSTLPWAMHFPGADGLRHPVQLYAMIKDLSLALLCYLLLRRPVTKGFPGLIAAVFFLGYAVLRFGVEFVRDQTGVRMLSIGHLTLSEGQVLTIPVFIGGLILLRYVLKRWSVPS